MSHLFKILKPVMVASLLVNMVVVSPVKAQNTTPAAPSPSTTKVAPQDSTTIKRLEPVRRKYCCLTSLYFMGGGTMRGIITPSGGPKQPGAQSSNSPYSFFQAPEGVTNLYNCGPGFVAVGVGINFTNQYGAVMCGKLQTQCEWVDASVATKLVESPTNYYQYRKQGGMTVNMVNPQPLSASCN
jgi:hypothetical protein